MNATVTLSIEELDKLRQEKQKLEEQVKEFEKNEKVVKLFVTEITKDNIYLRNKYALGFYKNDRKFIVQTPEYINFEDVRAEIKLEEERKVFEKLGQLQRDINSQRTENQELRTAHSKKLDELRIAHKEELENQANKAKEVQKTLEAEIKRLNGDLVDLSKDEQIKQLEQKIEALQNKTFFRRVFNL